MPELNPEQSSSPSPKPRRGVRTAGVEVISYELYCGHCEEPMQTQERSYEFLAQDYGPGHIFQCDHCGGKTRLPASLERMLPR